MATKSSRNTNAVNAASAFSFIDQFNDAITIGHPWDSIIEFAESSNYCGFRTLYPRQKTLLKLIYLETENMSQYDIDVIDEWTKKFSASKDSYGVQKDIWDRVKYLKDNGYRRFPHVQPVMGRRASKGLIGGITGAESIAHMISLDNFQQYYGVAEGKDAYLSVVATQEQQAIKYQYGDIVNAVRNNKYLQKYAGTSGTKEMVFRTPADIRRIAELQASGVSLDTEIATVRAIAMSSNSPAGRGAAGFALYLDEFAHMLETEGSRSSTAVYSSYKPSLEQFKKDQFLYVASSPYTKVGKFYELYTQGSVLMDDFLEKHPIYGSKDRDEALDRIEADPTKLIIQLASWDIYKDWDKSGHSLPGVKFVGPVIDYDMVKREEKNDPQKFKVEFRGQFAEVIDGYLDAHKVDEIFEPYEGEYLKPIEYGLFTQEYHSHLDPGRTNANFAMTIAHGELSEDVDKFGQYIPHVIIDYMKVWKPSDYDDGIIDYSEVQDEIESICSKFQTLSTLTFDQWNSANFISYFNKKFKGKPRVGEETATEKINQQRYETFKMAVNMGMVHSYRDEFYREGESLLEQELKFLQEKNGKVIKQAIGPVTTKDLSDTVVIVTNRILHDYFENYNRKRLSETKLHASNIVGGINYANDRGSYGDRMNIFANRSNNQRFGGGRGSSGNFASRGRFG